MLKFNPFQPNRIVAPGMFVGRVEELDQIEKCLFQTQNENPQNFLIIGERGIGKSSLLYYVDILAKGEIKSIDGHKFNFITCSIDLGNCQTELDIVRNVAKGLHEALSVEQQKLEAAKKVVDFLANWEVLGVRYHKQDTTIDPEDICDQLILQLAEFCKTLQGDKHGVLLLLDEADQPQGSANLGKFCKYFTERLTKKGCNSLVLGIAGLPNVLERLRESHESSPRLFEIVHLETLELEERKRVVQIGIELANQKNEQKTTINANASQLIAELSEGYPHFVQQFAHSAFDSDDDNHIDSNDVSEGAYRENGAIAQLGKKYFDSMYFGRIGSDDYRVVLNTMALHGDKWVSRKQIIDESNVKSTTVSNALNALKTRNIILSDEARKNQGYYRLPTKSFAVWINAINQVSKGNPAAKSSLEAVFEAD